MLKQLGCQGQTCCVDVVPQKGFSELLDNKLNRGGMLLGRMGAISGESRCVEEALSHLMDTAGLEPSDEDAASSLSVTDAGHIKRQTP